MFGLVNCNASILARQTTDPNLFFVRTLFKSWLWPIITFFGVTGNILAIIVLTKRRMIMSSTNNYLIALALVDIAYLVLTLILNTCFHPCFEHSSLAAILIIICKPMADFSSNTSVWITVTFTVERWVAITYPLKSRTWCTVRRARKIIVSVMLAALICTSPTAFEYKLISVSITEETNEKSNTKSRIVAEPTALGKNDLYHKIYFNFVTFAIIWIPLLLLIIFNTILIFYVHRSKQNDRSNSEGITLRRHNRSNQGEQRKTTIMLIAVVIVFTVCQIPQAISLTVQSFFPHTFQLSKVRMYNNFANCLVAINASMNFLLYCCFSERFRLTFGSSFAFLSKYCMNYMDTKWKKVNDDKLSLSIENMSMPSPCNQSYHSLHGPALNSRLLNISNDPSQKRLRNKFSNSSQKQLKRPNQKRQSWFEKFAGFHSRKDHWECSNTTPNSPTMSLIQSPSSLGVQQTFRLSNFSTAIDSTNQSSIEEKYPLCSSTVSFSPDISHSDCHLPLLTKNPSNECLKKTSSIKTQHLNKPSPILRSTSPSQQSVDNHDNKEQIWIKRRLSNNTIEQLFDRRKEFLWKEIIDVTV